MTAAEKLIEEGRAAGIKEGIEIGKAKGHTKGFDAGFQIGEFKTVKHIVYLISKYDTSATEILKIFGYTRADIAFI